MTTFDERVATVALDIIDTVNDRLAAHGVTHGEYRAACAWLATLADSGELPLFLDVHHEAAVERHAHAGKPGSEGTVLGPFHQANHPVLERPYKLPMRDDEPGDPFVFTGKVVNLDGEPVIDATIDAWQCANDGSYSGFGDDAPYGNLRGVMAADENGGFRFATIRPVPYPIPSGGPTGAFLRMTGRHAWRPAHFHFIVRAGGSDPLVTQIYFAGDEFIEGQGDVADAVKDSLVIDVGQGSEFAACYGIAAPYQAGEYTFVLRPSS